MKGGSSFPEGLLGIPSLPMFPQRPPNGFASLMGPVHYYPNYQAYYGPPQYTRNNYYQNY